MTNLFAAPSGPRPIVSFRAGRMFLENGRVTAESPPRKGRLSLSVQDGLLMWEWQDRGSGEIAESLVVFPNTATFSKVDKAKGGRVYVLQFKESGAPHFYWMQEPTSEKDEEYCNTLNNAIQNGPLGVNPAALGPMHPGLRPIGREALLGMMSGLMGGPQSTDSTPPATQQQPANRVDLTTLQGILGDLNIQATEEDSNNNNSGEGTGDKKEGDGKDEDPQRRRSN